jgi:hypothetical protein
LLLNSDISDLFIGQCPALCRAPTEVDTVCAWVS